MNLYPPLHYDSADQSSILPTRSQQPNLRHDTIMDANMPKNIRTELNKFGRRCEAIRIGLRL